LGIYFTVFCKVNGVLIHLGEVYERLLVCDMHIWLYVEAFDCKKHHPEVVEGYMAVKFSS
jgi:hypothetical protein